MTHTKIKIYEDKNAATAFTNEVAEVCDASNSLISLFNNFQPWLKVTTLEQWQGLVSDPAKFYDDTLLQNVKVQAVGVKPNPEKLAELVGLRRAEYLNLTKGLPLVDTDCPECQRVKVTKGKTAISKRSYEAYSQYLIFNSGTFSVDQSKVDADLDKFNTYAVSEDEIKTYEMFTALVETLNRWDKVYPFSGGDKLEVKRIFGLMLSRGHEGIYQLNPEKVNAAINQLKYENYENRD